MGNVITVEWIFSELLMFYPRACILVEPLNPGVHVPHLSWGHLMGRHNLTPKTRVQRSSFVGEHSVVSWSRKCPVSTISIFLMSLIISGASETTFFRSAKG